MAPCQARKSVGATGCAAQAPMLVFNTSKQTMGGEVLPPFTTPNPHLPTHEWLLTPPLALLRTPATCCCSVHGLPSC